MEFVYRDARSQTDAIRRLSRATGHSLSTLQRLFDPDSGSVSVDVIGNVADALRCQPHELLLPAASDPDQPGPISQIYLDFAQQVAHLPSGDRSVIIAMTDKMTELVEQLRTERAADTPGDYRAEGPATKQRKKVKR